MDEIDRQILRILQEDARRPQAEVGRRVGLSAPAVNERIKRLEKSGAIRAWTVLVDDRLAGNDITAFIDVFLEAPKFEAAFVSLMTDLPQVLECHYVTGDSTMIVKAKVPSREALRELVLDRINSLDGVRQTRTYIVLATPKEDPRVPVVEPADPEPPARSRRRKR
jgi:DNA-binding Lrp family transcriptional regulator